MSDASDSGAGADERLFELIEALRSERAAGHSPAPAEWAARFDLPVEEVRAAIEALELLDDVEGSADPDLLIAGVRARAIELLGDETAPAGGAALPHPAPDELAPPELPEDYELLGELGRGGMGVVYRARQRSLGRDVAVKVLRPGEIAFGQALRRFRREAQALARLRHPHIVAVHEVGDAEGFVYFTMDLVEGRSLAEVIAAGELTPSRSVRLLRQVASAIQYSHERGIVHRDLKPANVLVDGEDRAYVVDFGLARDLAVSAELTRSGHVLGTPAYMAPEQARGDADAIGEPTDVYALGAVLYECLTGRAPFAGLGLAELVYAVLHQDPPPPRRLAPGVPAALERVALQAMEKEPERRYPTARALLEDLERFESGRPVRAQGPSALRRLRLFMRRERSAVRATAITLALVALAFWQLVLPRIGATRQERLERAGELAAHGESAAALALYEDALGDASVEEASLSAELAALRLDRATSARRAGDAERASAQARRVVEDLEPRLAEADDADGARLRLPLAQALAMLALEPADGERVDELLRELADAAGDVDERLELTWRPGAPGVGLGAGLGAEAIRADLALRSEDSLLDPLDARHEASVRLWAGVLRSRAAPGILAHLAGREGGAVEVLVPLLRAQDSASERERWVPFRDYARRGGWRELLAAQDSHELAAAAVEVWNHPRAGAATQRAALELGCLAVGLPAGEGGLGEAVSADEQIQLLEHLLRSGRRDAADERARFVLEEVEWSAPAWTTRVRPWLRLACGLPAEVATVEAARAWWRSLAGEHGDACLAGLLAALDVPHDVTPEALLQELRRADGVRARRLHELLQLIDGGPESAPVFHVLSDEAPANLVGCWERALGVGAAPRLRARLAAVVVDLVKGDVRLEESRLVEVPPGERIEVALTHRPVEPPEPARRGASGRARYLGWLAPAADPIGDAGLVDCVVRGRTRWGADGRVLDWERAAVTTPRAMRHGVRGRYMSPGAESPLEHVTVAADLEERASGTRAPLARVLVLARFEVGDVAATSQWSLEEWCAALVEELRADAAPERLALVSWLAPDGALPALRAVGAEQPPPQGAGDLAARIMLGDGSVFESDEESERFRGSFQVATPGRGRSSTLESFGGRMSWWRLVAARPRARAALDPAALDYLAGLDAPRREEPAEPGMGTVQWVALYAFSAFVVLVFGGLLFGALRQVWRRRHEQPDLRAKAWWSALCLGAAIAWTPGGGGLFIGGAKVLALSLAGLAAWHLTPPANAMLARTTSLLNLMAAATFLAGLALGSARVLFVATAVGAALALALLPPIALQVWRTERRWSRYLQILLSLAFVLVFVLPVLADSTSVALGLLIGPEAAADVPLSDWATLRGNDLACWSVILWGTWVQALSGNGARDERAGGREAGSAAAMGESG